MAGSKRTTSTSGRNNKKTSAAKGSRGSSSSTRSNSTRSSSSRNSSGRGGSYGRTASSAARRREMEQQQEMQRDIILVLLFAGMVFLFLSNFGLFGLVGGAFQTVMMGLFGFAAYLLPVVIFALTLYGMMNREEAGIGARVGCMIILYIVFAIVCELVGGDVNADSALSLSGIYARCSEDHAGGGVIGGLLAWILMHTIRMAGTVLVLIVVAIICLVYVTRQPLLRLMQESAVDARDRVRYRREAEAEYRSNHPDEYDDQGFLPDEEDDDLTEDDIAAYRRRQAERARAEREERMREQARRDVERRHENRKEADRIFRGIVGDTDLSNDPWMRQQGSSQEEQALAGNETAAIPPVTAEQNADHEHAVDPAASARSETVVPTQAPADTAQTAVNSNTTEAHHGPSVTDTAATAATAAATISAAEQLLRNQRPGTDGIQLAASTVGGGETYQSAPESVQNAVRTAIPIHRESNNLHEINVEAYQGYYAALARDAAIADEDDEDLTSRIIREGLADLGGDENDRAAEEPAFGGARSAAADAFSRSHAFTEIQDAYGRDVAQPQTGAEISVADTDDEESAAYAAQNEPQAPVFEELHVPAEENDSYDVVNLNSSDADEDEDDDDDAAERVDAAATVIEPMEDAEDAGMAPARMGEITTPVGSGSAIAAVHAAEAQIHTEATAEQAQNAASPTAQPAATTLRPAPKPAPRKKPHKYVYPTLNLLNPGNPSKDSGSDDELRHTAEVLETTLHTFGVNCKITDISQGPAVTRYELLPEQGVKVSKVVGLSDDIKLALAAMDIRIEAPIPGKSAIGIEVPNKVTSMVALRDILSNANFRDHKSKLAIGIGKDISGQIVVSDLAKMPHVLIAGATGSGKSVCINTIIMSILYHAAPDEVKLLMIDPKVVELSVYNGIPHLLYPVVTNPQQAATLLNWAVAEMESRYRKFADAGVRDMKGYNQMVQHELDRGNTADADGNPYHVMPRIVVIVDELADLMMVAKNDVETAICRLAQLARAAGIHLIIATQRPSVDVITGLIKANMPSRIAFAVTSGVDSRTILDMNGAEKLLGKGDMLFFPQGLPKPARIQGAFVSDDEVMEVVSYIKDHNQVDASEEEEMRQQMDRLGSKPQDGGGSQGSGSSDSGNGMDDYFRRAGKFIIEKDNASIGLLQRGFRIGFNRAARLMDQLCEAGVVAESEGTKSRRILMTEAEFEAYCQQNEIQ